MIISKENVYIYARQMTLYCIPQITAVRAMVFGSSGRRCIRCILGACVTTIIKGIGCHSGWTALARD